MGYSSRRRAARCRSGRKAVSGAVSPGWPEPARRAIRKAETGHADPMPMPVTRWRQVLSKSYCEFAKFSFCLLLVSHSEVHDAFFIDVLPVVFADEFHHLVIRHLLVRERVGVWLVEDNRIFDRDLIVQNLGGEQVHPLRDTHLITVRHALILHRFLDTDGIDNERVAFPM